jgi:hypothetical protein
MGRVTTIIQGGQTAVKAGLTAAQKVKAFAKAKAHKAAKAKIIAKMGNKLRGTGGISGSTVRWSVASLVAAGLTYEVARRVMEKFNRTDGTMGMIRSMTDDTGKVYILFTPLGNDKTVVEDYCPGCSITITADNAVPSMVSPTPYIIDVIISTDDPQLQITSSTDFSTEATTGQFTYHADIESLAACAIEDLGEGMLCGTWTKVTGLNCKWVKIVIIAFIVLLVLSMLW